MDIRRRLFEAPGCQVMLERSSRRAGRRNGNIHVDKLLHNAVMCPCLLVEYSPGKCTLPNHLHVSNTKAL